MLGLRRSTSDEGRAIAADVSGEVSGQVAVGEHILQVHAEHGAIVNVAAPGERPRVRPRPGPIDLRPRDFPGLLGREAEVRALADGWRAGEPVAVHGEDGVGKSVLLRHVAHRAGELGAGGVVYLRAGGRPAADLLQELFEALFETDRPFRPGDAELRGHLREATALLLVDDVELEREDAEALLGAAPRCPIAVASRERVVRGEGRDVPLRGLGPEAGLALVERELGRQLTPDERPSAEELVARLGGHPLRILQAAELARDEGRPLVEAAGAVAADGRSDGPASALTDEQRRALALLDSLRGAPLAVDHAGAIADLVDPGAVLDSLRARGLAQAHSPRYSARDPAGEVDPAWCERACRHFAAWLVDRRPGPAKLLPDLEATVAALEGARRAERWPAVLALARALDPFVALSTRVGAWGATLAAGREAARALGHDAAEAGMLHGLGSRALALGDVAAAREYLGAALRLREALGDARGASVTEHNLAVARTVPGGRWPWSSASTATLAVVGVVALGAGTAGAIALGGGDDGPDESVPLTTEARTDEERTTDGGSTTGRSTTGAPTDPAGRLRVGPIRGPDEIQQGESATYSVTVRPRSGPTLRWEVEGARIEGPDDQRTVVVAAGFPRGVEGATARLRVTVEGADGRVVERTRSIRLVSSPTTGGTTTGGTTSATDGGTATTGQPPEATDVPHPK